MLSDDNLIKNNKIKKLEKKILKLQVGEKIKGSYKRFKSLSVDKSHHHERELPLLLFKDHEKSSSEDNH